MEKAKTIKSENYDYISLMEKALSAYSESDIRRYFENVGKEGLKEHGFPRLTANLGILIANGRKRSLIPLFSEMAELCTREIPRVRAANEFSVHELTSMLCELRKSRVIPVSTLSVWSKRLCDIRPRECYTRFAEDKFDRVNNWGIFSLYSEFTRSRLGAEIDMGFVDLQIENQLRCFDSNGMYRDPGCPMVYDLVARALFSLLLYAGYNGRYAKQIDEHLKKAGLLTLRMQGASGEIAYGGRSAQLIFNEAILAIVLEYEAARYKRDGDIYTAGLFKAACRKALKKLNEGLSESPMSHVKNRFPRGSGIGCEEYAYFEKYMTTVASYLYMARSVSDGGISIRQEERAFALSLSEGFHKVFLSAGEYSAELDTNADPRYDCSGLGRLIRNGAPSAICISHPAASSPKYRISGVGSSALSISPGFRSGKGIVFSADSGSQELTACYADSDNAYAHIICTVGTRHAEADYTLSPDGLKIECRGDSGMCLMLPAFLYDGETQAEIKALRHKLSVSYRGYVCIYETDGSIFELEQLAENRNGVYKIFTAEGLAPLTVKIRIEEEK